MMMMMMGIYPQERRIKHYSSTNRILLVGEGDFSFSLCLARAFNSATNIVATSIDSHLELLMKYQNAKENLEELQYRGAYLMHEVDATTMSCLDQFQGRKFDRIIFNFPHAGFYGKEDKCENIEKHRNLVRGFLSNASCMLLSDGEIHVNHKLTPPFDKWKLKELASECSLLFIGLEKFMAEDYQGYENKRGSGPTPDRRFPLKECGTFMYRLHPISKGTLELQRTLDSPEIRLILQQQPTVEVIRLCSRIFDRNVDYVVQMSGISSCDDLHVAVHEALRLSLEMYKNAAPERPSSEYAGVLQVFHRLSIVRYEQLRQMLTPR